MVAVKLVPHLLCFVGITIALVRALPEHRGAQVFAAGAGFLAGGAGTFFFFPTLSGELFFDIMKDLMGGSLLLLWGISVAALYRVGGKGGGWTRLDRAVQTPLFLGACAFVPGAISGAVSANRLFGSGSSVLPPLLLALVAGLLSLAALPLEKLLPKAVSVSPASLATLVVSLLLLSSSSIIRLDLFAPLTMKVMKFDHDFVHQFFESMLIPDHLFFNGSAWKLIGFLFGKEIGFWGALVLWFAPVLLVALAIRLHPLPQVAHIRQGAQRRKLLAQAARTRSARLIVPAFSLLFLALAVYRSLYPSVEYWDPKPVAVTATAAGEILIPRKGEIDLEDGKLHKYLFSHGGTQVRFFVLMTPQGKLTVDLDACAICKPDGYGQAEGTVICYYCKTLIPLDTVGKPGGCNPVPVSFQEREDGVHLDSVNLMNAWTTTVQTTARVKGGGQ